MASTASPSNAVSIMAFLLMASGTRDEPRAGRRRLLRVEHHEGVTVAGFGFDGPTGVRQVLLRRRRDGLNDVDRAIEGGGQTRSVILQGVPVDRVNGRGGVAVVVFVGNRDDLLLADLGVLVGTEPIGLAFMASVSAEAGVTMRIAKRSFRAAKGYFRWMVTALSSLASTESTKV